MPLKMFQTGDVIIPVLNCINMNFFSYIRKKLSAIQRWRRSPNEKTGVFKFDISDSLNQVSKEKWVYITSKLAYVSLFCGPRVKYSFKFVFPFSAETKIPRNTILQFFNYQNSQFQKTIKNSLLIVHRHNFANSIIISCMVAYNSGVA